MLSDSIKDYYLRLWSDELRHKVPWARDGVILGVAMLTMTIPVAAAMYGAAYVRTFDWRLIKSTLVVDAVILLSYAAYHLVRAAWKSDLDRQEEIRGKDVTIETQKQAFNGMLLDKDRELRDAVAKAAYECRDAISVIQKECDSFERELSTYKLVWGVLQSRTGTLAKELRMYCEETVAPEPIPPPIDGESDADTLVRKVKLMQPWMDKINREYNSKFAERVGYLRDYFAAQGYEDLKLDYRVNTAVVHTDQVREIADRLMGLALRELAKRQLRTLTLKQLCCD